MIRKLLIGLMLVTSLSPAFATLTFRLSEEGGNVVARMTGSVNTAALSAPGASPTCAGIGAVGAIQPNTSTVCVAGSGGAPQRTGLVGPVSIGPGGVTAATSGSGQVAYVQGATGSVFLPAGYVSGSPIAGTSTFAGATFASLGVTPGTYTYTFGAGPTADAVLIVTGPAPAAAAPADVAQVPTLGEYALMALAALLMLSAMRSLRWRTPASPGADQCRRPGPLPPG